MQTLSKEPALSNEQLNFLIFINELEFGEIRALPIVDGVPVINTNTEVYEDIKFSTDNGVSKLPINGKSLKPQVKDFIQKLSQVKNGKIESLVIKHGIPFSMRLKRAQYKSIS